MNFDAIHNGAQQDPSMPVPRSAARRDLASIVDGCALSAAALLAFSPVFWNQFVNWDDPTVLLHNTQLVWPAVVPWAFRTTYMGHYQPLAWLAWSVARAWFGDAAAGLHALSLAGHVINTLLVYAVSWRLASLTFATAASVRRASLFTAMLFALHPVTVEPVAWASALPYILSLIALLCSLLAYLDRRVVWSLALYVVSLLTRATALGFPVVLLLLDAFVLDRKRAASTRRLLLAKLPFAAAAFAAALMEWRARDVATLQEVGIGARLTLAATTPLAYLGRLLAPLRLSPLDPLPIVPEIAPARLLLGAVALAAITLAAWRVRRTLPAVFAGWTAYLVLLAPTVGLTPSGVQATADRYLYVPIVALALLVGAGIARLASRRSFALAAGACAVAALAALGVLTWRQAHYWRDSIALWSRAVELDPRNDVATYNLAIAFADAGRDAEAIGAYEATLRLVPDHDLARRNLARLQASEAEREAGRLAAEGNVERAEALYARAIALDGGRTHARAARGVLLARRGRFADAVPELRTAFDAGAPDAEVPNALAFSLAQLGDERAAADVLRRAVTRHPGNINLEHNLARLLATSDDRSVRDGDAALRLALDVCEKTGSRDARALDTLAAAYAATGDVELARATAARAAARARETADAATAAEIAAHAAAYGALTRTGASKPPRDPGRR